MAQTSNLSQNRYNEMSESTGINKWSAPLEEASQNYFLKYARNSENNNRPDSNQVPETLRSGGESNKRYTTEFSQAVNVEQGFKKIKYNQIQALNELKQEYEILRNIPIQDQFLKFGRMQPSSRSEYSSQGGSQTLSYSSKTSKKSRRHEESSRSAQIWALEKRQLEIVLSNSMRKIEELLNNEVEDKKLIQQLQIQLDSSSMDETIEALKLTMKRNQNDLNDKIDSLKRELERCRNLSKQWQEKNEGLSKQIAAKNQENKKLREQKRDLEDKRRQEKSSYCSLELELKRVKMEAEITEKGRESEISRLKSLVESQHETADHSQYELIIRRLQNDIQIKQQQYDYLEREFQRYKGAVKEQPREIIERNMSEEQFKLFQTLISHIKRESLNQNKASMDLLASVIEKIDRRQQLTSPLHPHQQPQIKPAQPKPETTKKQNNEQRQGQHESRLLSEIFELKNEIIQLRREKSEEQIEPTSPFANRAANKADLSEYAEKIRMLELEIADGSVSKQNLLKEYNILKSSYEYNKEEYNRLNKEYQELKLLIQQPQQQYSHLPLEELRIKMRSNEVAFQDEIRQLKRRVDQSVFKANKIQKQANFNQTLARAEYESTLKLIQDENSKLMLTNNSLRAQLDKMKAFYEGKIQQKNFLLQKSAQEQLATRRSHEQVVESHKANSGQEIGLLMRKLQSLNEVNERYLMMSSKYAECERELSELRHAMRKYKSLSDGVDHLWTVKETEYYNVNEILKQVRAS